MQFSHKRARGASYYFFLIFYLKYEKLSVRACTQPFPLPIAIPVSTKNEELVFCSKWNRAYLDLKIVPYVKEIAIGNLPVYVLPFKNGTLTSCSKSFVDRLHLPCGNAYKRFVSIHKRDFISLPSNNTFLRNACQLIMYMCLCVHENGSYRQVRHLSFSVSPPPPVVRLTKSARCFQSAILYALTTHKGRRKLSILSFRRYIPRRAEKRKRRRSAESGAIADFLSRKYDQKWRRQYASSR